MPEQVNFINAAMKKMTSKIQMHDDIEIDRISESCYLYFPIKLVSKF